MKTEKGMDVKPVEEKKEGPWKMRFLYGALGGSVAASLLWLIAISTNYWVFWDLPPGEGVFRPATRTFLLSQYGGMWQICRKERFNETSETSDYCTPINFYPSEEEIERDPETDRPILNYRRAVTAVAIIGIIGTVIAIAFTWYSVRKPRYIFKRLAGCLLVGCAACILVAIETFHSMIIYEKDHLPARYPPQSTHYFGFSYGLAWFCFVLYVTASLVLFIYSRKKKDKGDHDNPVIIGRI